LYYESTVEASQFGLTEMYEGAIEKNLTFTLIIRDDMKDNFYEYSLTLPPVPVVKHITTLG
jgi:hypothetical protein